MNIDENRITKLKAENAKLRKQLRLIRSAGKKLIRITNESIMTPEDRDEFETVLLNG
jgi:hypothetical protein